MRHFSAFWVVYYYEGRPLTRSVKNRLLKQTKTATIMDKFSNKESLFERLKAYDRKAQKALYDEVFPKLCKSSFKIVKNREEAEDIAIDRLRLCLQKVQEMENYEHLVRWLFIATRNLSFKYLRKEGDRNKLRQNPIHLDQVEDNATMNEIIEHEIEASIRNHMADDNFINKMVAQLAFIDGMTNPEIADLLGISEKSVRNRKSRMRPGLKEALQKGGFFIFILIATYSMHCSDMKNIFKKPAFCMRQKPTKPGSIYKKNFSNHSINTYQHDTN